MLSGNFFSIQPWEEGVAGSAGVSVLTLRFALAFFASIVAGFVFRFVPSVKGIDPISSAPTPPCAALLC